MDSTKRKLPCFGPAFAPAAIAAAAAPAIGVGVTCYWCRACVCVHAAALALLAFLLPAVCLLWPIARAIGAYTRTGHVATDVGNVQHNRHDALYILQTRSLCMICACITPI